MHWRLEPAWLGRLQNSACARSSTISAQLQRSSCREQASPQSCCTVYRAQAVGHQIHSKLRLSAMHHHVQSSERCWFGSIYIESHKLCALCLALLFLLRLPACRACTSGCSSLLACAAAAAALRTHLAFECRHKQLGVCLAATASCPASILLLLAGGCLWLAAGIGLLASSRSGCLASPLHHLCCHIGRRVPAARVALGWRAG